MAYCKKVYNEKFGVCYPSAVVTGSPRLHQEAGPPASNGCPTPPQLPRAATRRNPARAEVRARTATKAPPDDFLDADDADAAEL